MARPFLDIDADKVVELAAQGLKAPKIAEILGVSHDTIRERFGQLIRDKHEEMGRPLIPVDENKIAELALNGARNSEIAYIIGIDDKTLVDRFSRLLNKKRAERRLTLRTAQTSKAMSGDATMLIWLGKNELEQTDKVEQQYSGGITIQVVYEDVDPNGKTTAIECDPNEPQGRPSPLL